MGSEFILRLTLSEAKGKPKDLWSFRAEPADMYQGNSRSV